MNSEIFMATQRQLDFKKSQIEKVLSLTEEGNTIPFIARYRKEMTGNLDEIEIKKIIDTFEKQRSLYERKQTIINAIEAQEKLTPELRKQIEQAEKLQDVEDLYLPYKRKKKTKASIAKENGLLPLAVYILKQNNQVLDYAKSFVNENINSVEKVLDGAIDILAESFAEDVKLRRWTRHEAENHSLFESELKKADHDEKRVFEMYYQFSELASKLPNHRILALNRGEKLGVLKVKLVHDMNKIQRFYQARFITKASDATSYLEKAIEHALKKSILPAIDREIRAMLTERAEISAIDVFADNLKHLLLQSPLRGQVVLGFDPAYRTGAKLAIVDETGKLLKVEVIYPVKPAKSHEIEQAGERLISLIEKYQVTMISIGNGTASRESEHFVAAQLKKIKRKVYYVITNEAGASVYSASENARREFPQLTVEKRSAISIARRIQDPLAELVKIDPKSIGVGQYQHDVAQKKLTESLDFTVETVVNQVGVNLNTASAELLEHVAGLNKVIAENIVAYREANGLIQSRTEVKKVPRLGPKAFEQSAGFLRVLESRNPFDNTAIHPESYEVANRLLARIGIEKAALGEKRVIEQLETVNIAEMATELSIGETTLRDIVDNLQKPGRDIRENLSRPVLKSDVLSIEDLVVGQALEGTVRNVTDFGAFVDIGVKHDGLVHISKLANKFIKHPSEVVSVGDVIKVWVINVDHDKEKVGLSMIGSA
ncbi:MULTISPECIES: Tex family protein [unclassified Enterococcus]|uniref:Tex family protein n=1 Tax=unclassified Enterococcus TaxID=2608891 RepID=UPI0015551791|nr:MULTISPECIES: Tex family protein [unclassified Enterococcus]MBS7577212.1 RNA-binding transcriptional accessory protein [Enterococcus sp. MMGLQ5-2]MBS7584695.1 RNA-binding transcriptional accessory protein [Enterococcus sp. MMGLQ5-1]NPD12550.1 RNA-binding transcriptional accessory protein [Enterococcus sp. MMGLQ5-1]NPD37046.1 RNA-binding transcriptional accessory protein [Enterococcus sp. MMGLQ5-2]